MPRSNPINEIGNRYGRLVVVGDAGKRSHGGEHFWYCTCDCGTKKTIRGSSLRSGSSMSCGKCIYVTHGMSGTTEYSSWTRMKARCYDTHRSDYKNYGERGIYVCDRWKNSFETFYKDMGPKPSSKHSLDRVNNDGPYSPENCRWATMKEQQNNRRNNSVITHAGKTMTVTQWAEHIGVNSQTLYARMRQGWTVDRMLLTRDART